MERRLHEVRGLRSSTERVAETLLADPARVFGTPAGCAGRYHAEIVVDMGGGSSVHQVVVLEIGPLDRETGHLRCPLTWTPVGRQRVLPRFEGTLEVTEDRDGSAMSLTGSYRPPLGAVGAVGDAVAGRHVAQQSVGAFADELARRVEVAVDRAQSSGWRPAPYASDLRPATHRFG